MVITMKIKFIHPFGLPSTKAIQSPKNDPQRFTIFTSRKQNRLCEKMHYYDILMNNTVKYNYLYCYNVRYSVTAVVDDRGLPCMFCCCFFTFFLMVLLKDRTSQKMPIFYFSTQPPCN